MEFWGRSNFGLELFPVLADVLWHIINSGNICWTFRFYMLDLFINIKIFGHNKIRTDKYLLKRPNVDTVCLFICFKLIHVYIREALEPTWAGTLNWSPHQKSIISNRHNKRTINNLIRNFGCHNLYPIEKPC